jgi:hypothetical protein
MAELPTVKAAVHRLDVPCVRSDFGDEPHIRSAHFVLPSGECATLPLVALGNIIELANFNETDVQVQISPRDERLIGAGVVYSDEYPLLEQEPIK